MDNMQNMTLGQLRAAHESGGVSGVTLKARGGGFFVEIATRNQSGILLAKARSVEPRRFVPRRPRGIVRRRALRG